MARNVQDWATLNEVLADLYAFKDRFSLKNVDWNQRRIVNAHPSVDDYDYVVRKELVDTDTDRIGKGGGTGIIFDWVVFGVGLGSPIVIANDITPPRIVSFVSMTPLRIFVAMNQHPTGSGSTKLDIWYGGSTILSTPLILAAGSVTTVTQYTQLISPTPVLTRGNVLRIHCTDVANTFSGQDIEVAMLCKVNTAN